ncbi:hypothetical protein ACUN0C_04775 [Faunimonas sp. B44]|uniref:hypothetical protein n=1 Tax=Faunimonas sp. B44 TaxID=3461493 RepID=UPI0040443957
MTRSSSIPQIAREAGLLDRYRYWIGRSGARYLFTRTEAEDLPNWEGTVAILADGDAVTWVGPAAETPAETTAGCAVFVHFLASSPAERTRIIQDLAPGSAVSDAA